MERTKHKEIIVDYSKGTVFAWDPSMTAWGWAIMTFDGLVVDFGCIKTAPEGKKSRIRKSDDRCRRISEINTRLMELIKKYNVKLIVSEMQHGSQSAVAATMLGITIGMTQTLSDTLDIALETFSEGDSKLHLLGKRSAAKTETIEAISKKYVIKFTGKKYIDEAVADSISIFHVASKMSSTMKMLRK